MKVLFLGKTPDATYVYRVETPSKWINKLTDVEVRVHYVDVIKGVPNSGITTDKVEWADIIVFQRPITGFHLEHVQKIKKIFPDKIILGEYDDDYSSVPNWNPGYTFLKMHEDTWPQMIPLYDGVIASTEYLKTKIAALTQKPIHVIKNAIDFEVFDSDYELNDFEIVSPTVGSKGEMVPIYKLTKKEWDIFCQDRIVVSWFGSRYHFLDLEWLVDDIKKVAKENPNVVFLFGGYIQGNIVRDFPVNQLFCTAGTTPIAKYYKFLKSVHSQIGLAPVDPCEFNSSKSALKVYESMAAGMFPIASEYDTYEECAEQAELVGYEPGDWYRAITKWVRDHEGRAKRIAENNKFVRENHSAHLRAEEYVKFFYKIQEMRVSRV